ncbi:hypothetical protein BJ138DRAFT_1128916, partial [Hygrophoropsis aurantiaca]
MSEFLGKPQLCSQFQIPRGPRSNLCECQGLRETPYQSLLSPITTDTSDRRKLESGSEPTFNLCGLSTGYRYVFSTTLISDGIGRSCPGQSSHGPIASSSPIWHSFRPPKLQTSYFPLFRCLNSQMTKYRRSDPLQFLVFLSDPYSFLYHYAPLFCTLAYTLPHLKTQSIQAPWMAMLGPTFFWTDALSAELDPRLLEDALSGHDEDVADEIPPSQLDYRWARTLTNIAPRFEASVPSPLAHLGLDHIYQMNGNHGAPPVHSAGSF